MSALARLLSDAIDRRSLSQTQAARLLGTTQQSVGRWLAGSRPEPHAWPRLAVFLAISEAEVEASCPASRRKRGNQAGSADRNSTALTRDPPIASVTALPTHDSDDVKQLIDQVAALTQQRDELLRMVEGLAKMARLHPE
jgi:transcriptional regulator with XRE-family HTH domain